MSALVTVTYLTTIDDLAWSRITDLDIVQFDGTETLVGITRYDGRLQGWNIGGPTLSAGPVLALEGGDVPGGGTASIVAIQTASGPALLIGGGADGAFQQVTLTGGQWDVIDTLPVLAGFQPGLVKIQTDAHLVYGSVAGSGGIAALRFDSGGSYTTQLQTTPTDGSVVTMTMAADFIYTADMSNTLAGWQIDDSGRLSQVAALTPETGLWIADPTALKTAVVDGVTYLVLGAAGSSSLSVIEVGPQGSLTIRDHLLDTLHTRFGGVTSLEIITEGGRSYVIAGGADDGISVFALLAGGQLVALAHIEDTTSIGLDNVSAIAGHGRDGGLEIFVASSSEPGITQLRFTTGPAGVTTTANLAGGVLTGTDGNDILLGGPGDDIISGGGGDDILRDGAGTDLLIGGEGADLFILGADGEIDIIEDFALGEDRLDLSLWPMLRDLSQLKMTITQTGFIIRYGEEEAIIHSENSGPIDYRLLTNADLLGGMRLPGTLTPGFAGPATPPPALTTPQPDIIPDQGEIFSLQTAMRTLATGNIADLRSGLQGPSVSATAGDRVITGNGGNDTLSAGDGNDLLLGRGGNDVMIAGSGGDILIGGTGNDFLYGGDGHDLLIGSDGNDRLDGGNGDDVLFGGEGDDTFIFTHGHDTISDFEQGIDRIILEERLWTGLTSAEDLLFLHGSWDGSRVTIDFGNDDILWIDGVTDFATLADDIALF